MISKAAVIIALSMSARFFTTSLSAKKKATPQPSGKIPNSRRNNPDVSGKPKVVRVFAGAKQKIKNQMNIKTMPIHNKSLIIPSFSAILDYFLQKIFFDIKYVLEKFGCQSHHKQEAKNVGMALDSLGG